MAVIAVPLNATTVNTGYYDNRNGDSICRVFDQAVSDRATWEEKWQEIYDLTMPLRRGFYNEGSVPDTKPHIYDETGVVGVQEFANRMQAGLFLGEFVRLEVGVDTPPDERKALQADLDEINARFFQELERSNFDQEIGESLIDLGVGTTNILMEPNPRTTGSLFHFSSVPQADVYTIVGPDGLVEKIFRLRRMRPEHIKIVWADAKVSDTLMEKSKQFNNNLVDLIECMALDRSSRSEVWNYSVVSRETKEIIYGRDFAGPGSNPWINARWAKASFENYGRGPLFNALPAIKTLNLTVQLILENADMAIAGIWTAEDDGIMNPDNIQLVPGTIVPIDSGSGGLQNLTPNGNFDVAQLVLTDMRHNVRKALYNETLGPREGTPASATEIAERMAELSSQVGATLNRLHKELVIPIFIRGLRMMEETGMIPEMPPIDGKEIAVKVTTPLAAASKHQAIMQMEKFVISGGRAIGPQAMMTKIDADFMLQFYAENYGIPAQAILSPQQQAQNAQQLGEAAGEMTQQGMDPAALATLATKGLQ